MVYSIGTCTGILLILLLLLVSIDVVGLLVKNHLLVHIDLRWVLNVVEDVAAQLLAHTLSMSNLHLVLRLLLIQIGLLLLLLSLRYGGVLLVYIRSGELIFICSVQGWTLQLLLILLLLILALHLLIVLTTHGGLVGLALVIKLLGVVEIELGLLLECLVLCHIELHIA